MAYMPITPEQFKEKLISIVRAHYAAHTTPLLLARLGTELDRNDAWPVNRDQRSLKQLIADIAAPDVDTVRDKRSPAYIAVVTPDNRDAVIAQIEDKLGTKPVSVRLEDVVRPALLAFCIDSRDQPVYIRRSSPFRYVIGEIPADQAADYVLVDAEFRRPGLRVDKLQTLSATDRADLANRLQKWALAHGVVVQQFYKPDNESKESIDSGTTALDRLLNAQTPDVAQRIMIPADIAQILARLR
jgi:hypothetical protein